MPQELRVVQCIQCEVFQVDIVKKANKWQCKLCNTKQNLRKTLHQGTGIECREMVQKLNQEKAKRFEQKSDEILELLEDDDGDIENIFMEAAAQIEENKKLTDLRNAHCQENEIEKTELGKRKLPLEQNESQKQKRTSKWDKFL